VPRSSEAVLLDHCRSRRLERTPAVVKAQFDRAPRRCLRRQCEGGGWERKERSLYSSADASETESDLASLIIRPAERMWVSRVY